MKKEILLVEDSPILSQCITDMLSESTTSEICDYAKTQKEAIGLLEKKQYDMMIVDIELAEGNGFEVVNHTLKKSYPYSTPIFIMLTNNASKHYRAYAKDLGIQHFFDKSMEFELAIDQIEALNA